jgi:hypothetical protein
LPELYKSAIRKFVMEDDRYRPSEVSLPPVVGEAEQPFLDSEFVAEPDEDVQRKFSVAELATEGIRKQPDKAVQKAMEAAKNDQPAELQREKSHEIMQNQSTGSPVYASQVGDIAATTFSRRPGLENFAVPSVAPPLPQRALSSYPVQSDSPSLYRKSILRGFVAGIIVLVCGLVALLIT